MKPILAIPMLLSVSLAATASQAANTCNHCGHEPLVFWGAGAEIDVADEQWLSDENSTLTTWNGFAWIGDDDLKLRIEYEGEAHDGETGHEELRALLSWNVSEFWDLQSGIRQDLSGDQRTWAALGFHGMIPYFIESSAFVFVDQEAHVSFRLEHDIDFAITQDLFLKPHIELDAYAQDIDEDHVGAGIASVEIGVQLRYEFTRKFAPYIDIVYERDLGETSLITQSLGEEPERTTIRAGLLFRL